MKRADPWADPMGIPGPRFTYVPRGTRQVYGDNLGLPKNELCFQARLSYCRRCSADFTPPQVCSQVTVAALTRPRFMKPSDFRSADSLSARYSSFVA